MENNVTNWHHSPMHVYVPGVNYMITAGTRHKEHIFNSSHKLDLLKTVLLSVTSAYDWHLHAWAVFSNHYHFVARAPVPETRLKKMLQRLHSESARLVNRIDHAAGRQVWHQYWDKCLSYERSYYARIKYVLQNAVHHKLVPVAAQYDYCSAAEFEIKQDRSFQNKINSFRSDSVNEPDDFNPVWSAEAMPPL